MPRRRPLPAALVRCLFGGWWSCAALILPAAGVAAPPPKESRQAAADSVADLVRQLDSDDFTTRAQARQRLTARVAQAATRQELKAELRSAWLSPNLSAEARALLEPICAQVPDAMQAAGNIDVARLDRLIAQLDSLIYSQREAAALELEPLAGRMPQALALVERLKHALDRPGVSLDARRQMDALWGKARGTWLMAPVGETAAPQIENQQIEAWIDALAAADGASEAEHLRADNAQRQLLDLLARDDQLQRVKKSLEARLAAEPSEAARARITALVDWTRPAMVAEYWHEGHHTSIQYLLVGIPSHPERAQRASHFDRCDDHKAHCVSGNSLSPGDWPVGVFFPHPLNVESMFHLVNLPTPRRRMAYDYEVQRDERLRLAELTEHTLQLLLAAKRPLDEREIVMLRFLEPHAVSRFAGKYLLAVPDAPVAPLISADITMDLRMYGSRHGLLCHLLIERGTHEAGPGLMRACLENKVLAPTDVAPYCLPWIASLAICERDPWPQADAWLEQLLSRQKALASSAMCPGQLGATAASILLKRHGMSPETFGLEAVGDEGMLTGTQFTAYRFQSTGHRDRVLDWWSQYKRQLAARPARSVRVP